MNDPIPFDPAEPIPEGRLVIEASAGTGKTFTIAATVTRLVAMEGIPLDQILVVTFTRAATAELKDRIRRRLVATVDVLRGASDAVDEHMRVLAAGEAGHRAQYLERLTEALRSYDGAQIFTIHGFASRLLRQLGFRSRLSPDLEPGEIDGLLLAQAASDLVVGRFAYDPEHVLKPGDVAAIGEAVVTTPDAAIVPEPGTVTGDVALRVEMAHRIADELDRRLEASGTITFDDGLVEARDALEDPQVGRAARALLAARYRVALIDESQDTDPVQWEVIRSVFDTSRLVVIGDPKQSIYAFRGADVESYLAAVEDAAAIRTLETNWRSDGPLLHALDLLLAGTTFGDGRIAYRRVRPASGRQTARISGAGPPLVVRRLGALPQFVRRRDGNFRVGDARAIVARDVAAEAVALLTCGATITDDDGERPVSPRDIAVLCRTRSQVELVRDQLTECHVPSVAARAGSVFNTAAAEDWRRLLLAVERPDRNDFVRLAATSSLIGLTAAEVANLSDDGALELQRRIRDWRDLLLDRGVPAVMAAVDRSTGVASRVLAEPDGERRLTDLVHIAEEMHRVYRRGRLGSLLLWLETAMEEARVNADSGVEEPESRQRRLETDAAAIQVQTIHAAKGLEYPIVFVPFAWDPPLPPPGALSIPVFHDPGPVARGRPRSRMIDVGGEGSPDFAAHQQAAAAEEEHEEARLLYVALTRARHLLRVWWVEDHVRVADTKLHELLSSHEPDLADLVAESGGTIAQVVVDAVPVPAPYRPLPEPVEELGRARLDRPLDQLWRRVSFSSLSPEDPVGSSLETGEEQFRGDEAPDDEQAEPVASLELPMAELPRGAAFGSLVHHVLEVVPLDAEDLRGSFLTAIETDRLRRDLEFDPELLADGLMLACDTPLGPQQDAPTLRQLDPGRQLKEMTFELPVRTEGGAVSLHDVGRVMLDHLAPTDPYRGYAERLRDLPVSRFRGYLAGAIDLTTVMADAQGADRFVVMDYKSNALAAQGEVPTTADYGGEPLAEAMRNGNYVLQALFYQVALHRYLQWRFPDYEPEAHLGGSMYLFIRGMVGHDTPVVEGVRCGVARWTPPAEMIVGVSRLFVGGDS